MPPDELEVAANRAFDDALDRMGADVCIWSVDLAIDEIAADVGVRPGDEARVRAAGGEVTIDSEPGAGTRARFAVPTELVPPRA